MSRDADGDRAEFGVLFVGGIGKQRPGSSVSAFAVALHGWLFWWNRGTNLSEPPSPVLHDAVLSPALCGDDPAHVALDVPQFESDTTTGRWLLAESSWGEAALAPRFLDLVHWFWKVSTCLLVLQFVIPMHRHWHQTEKDSEELAPLPLRVGVVVGYLILMGLAAILSVLLSLVLFALALAALLPIPRIDLAVHWVVVKLSAVLGDTYMLAHCPVEFAAMRNQVARDLGWLRDRCDRVAVVAHSQGAAITHQVLQEGYCPGIALPGGGYHPGSLRAFITLGQGISKLHLFQAMDWNPDVRKTAWRSRWLVAVGLAAAGLPALGWVISRLLNVTIISAQPAVIVIPMILAGFLLIFLGVYHAMSVVQKVCYDKLYLCIDEPGFLWTDYYASADPVSNGPFPETRNLYPNQSSLCHGPNACTEIYNASSLLTDHNSYLRNQDQLLPQLVNALAAAAYGGDGHARAADGPIVDKDDINKACKRRHRLARWLVALRVLIAAAAVTAWFFSPVGVFQGPMNQLARITDPHAQMSRGLVHVAVAALMTAAAYLVVVIVPWKIKEYFNTQHFFSTAIRKPVKDELSSDGTEGLPSSPSPESVGSVLASSENHLTS